MWTSDNGAANRNPPQGSNSPYKGMGYTTAEGGQRMPCIVRWPGKVPAGSVCDELCTMMDLLPTLPRLAAAPQPKAKIDGQDIAPLLFGQPGARSPYDETGFFYYQIAQLQAVRAGDWKLYLPLKAKHGLGTASKAPPPQALALYDVRHDVSERHEVSAEHPDIVARLTALAQKARAELGDGDQQGTGQRPPGHVKNPQPLVP